MDAATVSRRDRLLDAALAVFAREGVDAASIKKIGRAAGVAPALIYHYFENKEALLAAVVQRHGFLPQLHQLLAVAPDAPASEVLPRVAQDMYALLSQRVDLVRVVMATSQTHPEMRRRLEALTDEAQTVLARYLQARMEVGELRAQPTRPAALMLLFTVVMWLLADTPAAELDDAIAVLVAGLIAPSSPKPHRQAASRSARADGRNVETRRSKT